MDMLARTGCAVGKLKGILIVHWSAKAPSADTERAIDISFSAGAGHHQTLLHRAVALMCFTLKFN